MTWVALMVLAAAGTLYFVHLHRRMDAMRSELETRIGNTASVLRARSDRAEDQARNAQRRVDAMENFLANKALQSRYPGLKELEFHVEERHGRTSCYLNEVV